jgi:peptidoglycan/LPS O-acetylase OafA/YrhL
MSEKVNANALDLLRLAAALLVLYSHQHAVMGLAEPTLAGLQTLGGVGVTVFFFLSGMLVAGSWVRDPHAGRFFARRALRIFPGLFLVVLLSVAVLGPLLTELDAAQYWRSSETWRYLQTALLQVRYTLPGVFAHNIYPLAVNGSLWTLPLEFMCYVSVAGVGLVLLRVGGNARVQSVLGLWGAVVLLEFGPQWMGSAYRLYFEMAAVFWWGAVYGAWRQLGWMETLRQSPKFCVACGLALQGFVMLGQRGGDRLAVLLLAACLVHMALRSRVGTQWMPRLGDLSYGVYIFAFPVQQWVSLHGSAHGWGFGLQLAVVTGFTLVLAYASWHGIEKRALRFKPRTASITNRKEAA